METVPSTEAPLVSLDSNANSVFEAISRKCKGFGFLATKENDEHVVTYPPEVERRLKALKKIQVEMFNTECKFFEELHDLEFKYSKIYSTYNNKRSDIVSGKYEPTSEECDFVIPSQEDQEEEKKAAAPALEDSKKNGETDTSTTVSGLPRFWLTIFQNVIQFANMVEDRDEPILEHLEDIRVELTKEPMGFQLFFHFSPNEYFENKVLTKTYEMRVAVDPKDPFAFEGTQFFKSVGCKINWKEGKDVTVREIKKKQRHKSSGTVRMTNKLVANPSFFDFFSPPQVDHEKEDEDNLDTEVQEKIGADFELGSFLKDRIIPRAVLYYTGEALESDDELSDEEEEDSEEDDETDSENAHAEEERVVRLVGKILN